MTPDKPHAIDESKFIIRGVHLDLTDALRQIAMEKAGRLLRHNDHIIRIRLDLEHDKTRGNADQFIAKGRIEIGGPDLIASAHSDDAYKSIDLLVTKLDALLRERHGLRKDKRNHPHAAELDSDLPKV
ncbi:ribosome hibernation promoting factor HPF [Lacunisphaera limnophila]|uniref:Ribosome hibernation promoting factor HPF n=1 Tax=Lacunisphaera limnophila TaxID=1838286 RepID=A0A1D8AU39_9BACT|nr:ribosome-associated translation inhibitor RaiA [Lacunisphaera limnophila]AOS44415.1 ribosome hibernation promoting factor HPF [Lacunisphaera limnophila]